GGASRRDEGARALPYRAGERSCGRGRRASRDFRAGSRRGNPRTQGTMMAAQLSQFLGSPFCAKARKLLAFKGVEFEVVEVDYLERKELLLASGQMMVPALTLETGETIVDSARIAMRLEELFPEPSIFPPGWRGVHIALADYIDNQLEEALYAVALADELAHYRRQGLDREALWRLIRERKYGAGFVERTIANNT